MGVEFGRRQSRRMAALRSVLAPHVPAAPVRVVGGPSGRYSVAYANPSRLAVAVTNDFSWVQITNAEKRLPDVINRRALRLGG